MSPADRGQIGRQPDPFRESRRRGLVRDEAVGTSLDQILTDALRSDVPPETIAPFEQPDGHGMATLPAELHEVVRGGQAGNAAPDDDAACGRVGRFTHGGDLALQKRSERASEPRERSGDHGVPASERVGGSAGAKPPGFLSRPRAKASPPHPPTHPRR